MTQAPTQRTTPELRRDLPALTAVFLLIVGFTFSDDIVELTLDITGRAQLAATNRQWLVMGLDLLLVLASAGLARQISADRLSRAALVRKLLTGRWMIGAVLVIVGHLVLILTSERRSSLGDVESFWINVLASTVFVAAMTLLMLSVLSEKSGSRGWIAPLVFGTFVVQIGSALWYPVIDVNVGCAGEISPQFFSDMANMIAIVLLTTAVELNYVRRNAVEQDPGRRMAPVFIVLLLCTALALALSMDVKADQATLCGTAAVWHEYISFVVCIQAIAIGLATLVWLLLVDAVGPD